MMRTCVTCGETRGTFLRTVRGWVCLAHLGRIGSARRAIRGGAR